LIGLGIFPDFLRARKEKGDKESLVPENSTRGEKQRQQ
jgi:hypothetical protein